MFFRFFTFISILLLSSSVFSQDSTQLGMLNSLSRNEGMDTAYLNQPIIRFVRVFKEAPLDSSYVIEAKRNVIGFKEYVINLEPSYKSDFYSYDREVSSNTKGSNIKELIQTEDNDKQAGRLKAMHLPDWNLYMIGILLFLWIFISRKFQYFISLSRQAFWSDRILNVFIKSSEFLTSQGAMLSFLMVFLVVSLSIHFFNTESLNYDNSIINYLYTFFIILGYSIARFILIKISSFILESKEIFNTYLAIISSSFITISIYILPLLVLYLLVPLNIQGIILWFLITIPILLLVYQYFRSSYFILSSFVFPKFYLFLYLCALEIAPLLLIIKAFLQ